jgi:hypothetical protein
MTQSGHAVCIANAACGHYDEILSASCVRSEWFIYGHKYSAGIHSRTYLIQYRFISLNALKCCEFR